MKQWKLRAFDEGEYVLVNENDDALLVMSQLAPGVLHALETMLVIRNIEVAKAEERLLQGTSSPEREQELLDRMVQAVVDVVGKAARRKVVLLVRDEQGDARLRSGLTREIRRALDRALRKTGDPFEALKGRKVSIRCGRVRLSDGTEVVFNESASREAQADHRDDAGARRGVPMDQGPADEPASLERGNAPSQGSPGITPRVTALWRGGLQRSLGMTDPERAHQQRIDRLVEAILDAVGLRSTDNTGHGIDRERRAAIRCALVRELPFSVAPSKAEKA